MVTPSDAENTDAVNPFGDVIDRDNLRALDETGFWDAKPQLQLIYHAARNARRMSPWGLLGAVMAHRVSHIPPNVVLVDAKGGTGDNGALAEGTSLNMFLGLVAPAGGGKSATFRKASGLMPPNGVPLADGTGQGIVKKIAKSEMVTKDADGKPLDVPYPVVRFFRHSLTIHAPEITTLNAEFAREGSKTGGMMRSLWVGETVGMTNADTNRDASIPANMARVVGIWGVQPHNAGAIMAQTADGTPQRFLWLPSREYRTRPEEFVTVGTPPPLTTFPFPVFGNTPPGIAMSGTLPTEVRDENDLPDPIWVHWSPQMTADINAFYAAEDAADDGIDPYADEVVEKDAEDDPRAQEAHLLLMRIKLAAKLGFLWGNPEPDDTDWYLSGILLEASMGEAAGVWKTTKAKELRELERAGNRRGIELDATNVGRDNARAKRVEKVAEPVYTKLAQRGPLTESGINRLCGAEQKPYVRDALHLLEDNARAAYDGTLWYAVYKGNKLTKADS